MKLKVKSLIGVFSLIGAMACFTLASCDDDYSKYDDSVYLPDEPEQGGDVGDEGGGDGTSQGDSINGYEYVDLGLSVYWAACNVGATKPGEYGDYFAWGEVEPKDSYSEDNYTGPSDDNISGNPEYDAATANWGSPWRMPTVAEFQEMLDNCTLDWARANGNLGFEATSTINGKSIFIPAAGQHSGNDGIYVYYWTSERATATAANTWVRAASDDDDYGISGWAHWYGRPVRPVADK